MIIHKIKSGAIAIDAKDKIIRKSQYEIFLSARDTLRTIKQEHLCAQKKNDDTFHAMEQKGYAAGQARAQQEALEQHIEFCTQAIHWVENLEEEIFLALSAALEKIIGAIDTNTALENIIRKTLKHYIHLPELKICLAPEQKPIAQKVIEEIAKEHSVKSISIETDERFRKNDCLLESPLGSVDASLEVQLAQLKALFAKMPKRALSVASSIKQEESNVSD